METARGGRYQVCMLGWEKASSGGRVMTADLECDTMLVGQFRFEVSAGDWQRVLLSQPKDDDREMRTAQAFTLTATDRIEQSLAAGAMPEDAKATPDEVDRAFNYVKIDQELPIGISPGDVILELNVYQPPE
jgi:hypothetical protein